VNGDFGMFAFRGQLSSKPLLARTSASHGAVTKAQGGGTSLIRGGGGFGWRAFSSARRSIMSTLTTQLKSDIDKLWTEFWTGGITNPLTVIEQISFLMFARLLDVMETTGDRNAERLKSPSRVASTVQTITVAKNFKQKDAAEMLRVVRDELFPHFRKLNGGTTFSETRIQVASA
jgi:predicted XRE-type DNA-binding protein